MNTKEKGKGHDPQYHKEEERTAQTYQEAKALAQQMFAPFQSVPGTGEERTTRAAKVRIRCKTDKSTLEDSFVVCLYKRNKPSKAAKVEGTEDVDDGGTEEQSDTEGGEVEAKSGGKKAKRNPN